LLFVSFDASIDGFDELDGELLGFIELVPLGLDDDADPGVELSDEELAPDDGDELLLEGGGVAGVLLDEELDDGGVALEGEVEVSVF
jgi:hypothetical protein